jgi:diguanylate cyclase (GGDEF)-like protein
VGIVVCDIDGLKLINDTLGHEKGNELLKLTSSILRKACREGDCTARIGGDEFVLLLPSRSCQELDDACRLIHKNITAYNADHESMLLSLSLGSCWQENGQYIHDALQEADNSMYRHKLHNGQSARSAILQALMKALEARDFATQGHTERVGELALKLASHLDLAEQCVTDIWLLSKFHDIGKVGIPDQILFKEGPLTKAERAVINRHSEIGYRIARSASDISHVADFILKHHEWWDGKGYPLGLKGEEIPIECRIVAIADAFDAMTNDRPYRKAMSDAEASRQLELFAGQQFDPLIVQIFLEKVINDSQK